MSMGNQAGGLVLLALFLSFLQMGLLAFAITLFVVHRKRIREFFKPGLVFGVVCFAFNLPLSLFILSAIDFGALMPMANLGPAFTDMFSLIVVIVSIISSIGGIAVVMFHYVIAAAEWDGLRPRPFPVFMKTGEKAWGRIGIAALVGAGAAVVSMILGKILKVGAGDILRIQEDLLVNFKALPELLQLVLMLLYVISAAVSEELLYRGALFGFLCRISKNRMSWLLASIFAVSLLWAFMHVLNTDNPAFKLAQVFILGTVFAEFARRWSLESAMAAHISLNVTAVMLGYISIFQ